MKKTSCHSITERQTHFFLNNKYVVLENHLSVDLISVIKSYIEIEKEKGKKMVDPMIKNAYCWATDPFFDSILLSLKPIMEKITGKLLFPTYSYLRIYSQGDDLEKHVDRKACEYSCSITLDYDSDSLWPIFIRPFNEDIPIITNCGDILVYKGCEVVHWREKFIHGNSWTQMFLHYVDSNGSFASEKYDKRSNLGTDYF